MFEQNLALNNLKWLIYRKPHPTKLYVLFFVDFDVFFTCNLMAEGFRFHSFGFS